MTQPHVGNERNVFIGGEGLFNKMDAQHAPSVRPTLVLSFSSATGLYSYIRVRLSEPDASVSSRCSCFVMKLGHIGGSIGIRLD